MKQPGPFGHFELKQRLAIGGLFESFIATRGDDKRRLVVALLFAHADESLPFREALFDGLNLAAQVRHPGLVRIEDFGRIEERTFVCTEYVEGSVLRVPREVLSPVAVAQLGLALGEALQAAHESVALVHGAIKPSNVMVTPDGKVKLRRLGFTLAEDSLSNVFAGRLVSKLGVSVTPERLRGVAQVPSSDVFLVGQLLFETLTGRRLFEGETDLQRLRAVLEAPVPDLSGFPQPLTLIIRQALAKNPSERFETAGQMAEALRAFVASAPSGSDGLGAWAARRLKR